MTIEHPLCAKRYHEQEQVREVLKPYPNLEAIVIGCVSGQVTEWPMIRGEIIALVGQLCGELSVLRDESAQWEKTSLVDIVQERDRLREALAQVKATLASIATTGVTEDILRAQDGFIKIGKGCVIVRDDEYMAMRARIAELEEEP